MLVNVGLKQTSVPPKRLLPSLSSLFQSSTPAAHQLPYSISAFGTWLPCPPLWWGEVHERASPLLILCSLKLADYSSEKKYGTQTKKGTFTKVYRIKSMVRRYTNSTNQCMVSMSSVFEDTVGYVPHIISPGKCRGRDRLCEAKY